MRVLILLLALTYLNLPSPAQAQLRPKKKPQSTENNLLTFTSGPNELQEWPRYLEGLDFYQRYNNDLFRTSDTIRWDRISKNWLTKHVTKWGRVWLHLRDRKLKPEEVHPKKIKLSRLINQELYEYIIAAEKKSTISTHLHGSTLALQQSIPQGLRRSLTPLDDLFISSDLGKNIFKKIKKSSLKTPASFVFHEKSKTIYLNLGNGSSADKFRIKYSDIKGDESKSRIEIFKDLKDSILPPIDVSQENYESRWINAKSKSRKPLGKFPSKKEQFLIEGNTHFSGDGHKH